MGAIAAIVDLPTNEQIDDRMYRTMKHRSLGAITRFSRNGKTLLQSGGDASASTVLAWGAEEYFLVGDVTLFNAEELKAMLGKAGHRIDRGTDEDILLHAYAEWGEAMLEKINGTFAFIVVGLNENKVFFARDRIGVKPLFYTEHAGGVLLTSEMKTLLSYPHVQAQLDALGAAELLLLGPGRRAESGVFYGVNAVAPGTCGTWAGGNLRLRRYWRLTDRVHTDNFAETVEKVRFLLEDSVKIQLKDRKNPATMLSGGLDSSVVSALCARTAQACGGKLNTFSVDYVDNEKYFTPEFFQPNMDTEFVRIMHEHLHSTHRRTLLTSEDLVSRIADATIARDLPGMADVDTSLLAFCEQIRPHTDVILSGECADEIFGGYPWYRDSRMRDVDTFPWAQTTAERTRLLQPWVTDEIDPTAFVADCYLAALEQADILPENDPLDRRIKELVNLNFDWFMQTLIDRGDRMGGACGLDIRMPFCDYRIAEYLYGVPWEMKDRGGAEKGLLRAATADLLPPEVLYRKKSPFPKTYDPQYLQIVSEMLNALLQDKNAPIFALVRPEALSALLTQDFTWPWYGQLMRRPQTIVYMLQINFWLEHYSVQIR